MFSEALNIKTWKIFYFSGNLRRLLKNHLKGSFSWIKVLKTTPVMTPDVLWETDVDGAVVVLTMCCADDEPAVVFGTVVRMIWAFSLLPSLTIIVVSTCRDCPRDRCWGNVVFWSFDATLKVFNLFRFSFEIENSDPVKALRIVAKKLG